MIEDHYQLSLKHLLELKEKFDKDVEFRDRYHDVTKKQIELRVMEKAETDPIPGKGSYLSHFAVIRDDRETTKPRIVYNGSAKTKGPSLNDCLYKGKNLNLLVFDIITISCE